MTNLMGMSFKDFIWPDNPVSLTVSGGRNVRETEIPYAGTRTVDMGAKKRRVTGEGYFTGETCWKLWNSLYAAYAQGGPGALRLPGQEPFLAVLDSLKLMGAAGKNLVKYAFSFTEFRSGEEYKGAGLHLASEGESLWDYAWRYGRTVEELTAANPDIADIACLRVGEEVRVP